MLLSSHCCQLSRVYNCWLSYETRAVVVSLLLSSRPLVFLSLSLSLFLSLPSEQPDLSQVQRDAN